MIIRYFCRILLLIPIFFLICACKVTLYHGLEERDVNEMVVLLSDRGIPSRKSRNRDGKSGEWRIEVNQKDSSRAWQILEEGDLPRPHISGFTELFTGNRLIPSEVEERAKFIQALCGELSGTLEAIPGVIDARVHIVSPQSHSLWDQTTSVTPKAAVMLRLAPSSAVARGVDTDTIQRLVANSVEQLSAQDVEVIAHVAPAPPVQVTDLIAIGPIKIASESLAMFKLILVALLIAELTPWILLLIWSRRILGRIRDRHTADPGMSGTHSGLQIVENETVHAGADS